MKPTRRPLICLLILFVSGCGTVRNLSAPDSIRASNSQDAPKIVFGVIKQDFKQVHDSFHQLTNRDEHPDSAIQCVGGFIGGAVDAPFSIVGDSLTLPITIPAAIDRGINAYYFPEGRRQKVDEAQQASEDTGIAN